MNNTEFKALLEKNPELKNDLFIRGFLVSDKTEFAWNEFPFYGNWKSEQHGGFLFAAHNLTGLHIVEPEPDRVFFLMGHAYNPFTMEISEEKILSYLADAYGTDEFIERVNELTGVFLIGAIVKGSIEYFVDPSGMQTACYGIVEGQLYISSHPQLIADVCGLQMDEFVKRLISYKWYPRVFGCYLPADMTPFAALKSVVPNIKYRYDGDLSHLRIWPTQKLEPCQSEDEYRKVIEDASNILKNSMTLVAEKWAKPRISLTGGVDSNTTFAAANGYYDRISAFSFDSAPKEIPDCEAAEKIAKNFSVPWDKYTIPTNENEIRKYEERVRILEHNTGYIVCRNPNELRKFLYLADHFDGDVEVKSYVSETIRAYWYKHYGRKRFPPLSAKMFRNMYKIFLTERKLAHELDAVFDEFIKDYGYDRIPQGYDITDLYNNDLVCGEKGSLHITMMKVYTEFTFIYDNRKFLEMSLRVPLDKRISDQNHADMKQYLNKKLSDMNIRVVNKAETSFRAWALNVIFTLNSILP